MVNYANFSQQNNSTIPGSYVVYEGKPALVKWGTPWSDTLTLEVDGKTITVNKNDLFGINNKIAENQQEWFSSQIEKSQKELEINNEKMTVYKELYANASKEISKYKDFLYNLLRKNNVSSHNELKGDEQKEYLANMAALKDSKSAKWHAGNGINHTAMKSLNEALYLGDLQNQQALFEAMTR